MNLFRYAQLLLILSGIICGCRTSENEIDWTLKRTEIIEYEDRGAKKIQKLYSALDDGILNLTDTSIIVQLYQDTLLLEETEYNIKNGQASKWIHRINEFNANGLLSKEVDSVDGSLRTQNLFFYQDGKCRRTELLLIFPAFNNGTDSVAVDTMRTTLIHMYDKMGECTKVMTLRRDELASSLAGASKYDTSVTYHEYNSNSWHTGSFTIEDGDTTSISRIGYDELGRAITLMNWSAEMGMTTSTIEYDKRGNQISELCSSEGIMTPYGNGV